MGWHTKYNLEIDNCIENWDGDVVNNYCNANVSGCFDSVYYNVAQYQDPYVITVIIKRGRYGIIEVAEIIKKLYNCSITIEVVETDDLEFGIEEQEYIQNKKI
jgi:hypothetical protein